jgi:hypothetical protein
MGRTATAADSVMVKISFVRSGGFVAAPGLQVRASVTLDASGGVVVAEPDYHRVVDPQESADLARAAEALAHTFRQDHGVASRHDHLVAADAARTPSTAARDAFRFQFTIESSSGAHADLRASDVDLKSGPPELGRLVQWAAREADAIVRKRFGSAS